MDIHLVFCSCPDRSEAERLAKSVIEDHLAACVTLLPGATSYYRWNGRLEQSQECLLLIKTGQDRLAALTQALKQQHSYELPEVLAVKAAGGLPAYLSWVAEQSSEPL